eukprot:COSAG01_NODE_934_length_12642_cov_100.963805_10_plen_69_part_00
MYVRVRTLNVPCTNVYVSSSQPKKKQRTEVEDQGGPVGDSTFGVSFSKSVMRPQKIELQEGEGAFVVA